MRVLAMDTSFDPYGMALADEKGIVGAMTFRHERDLSRWWAPRLQWLLAEVGWRVEELEGFAVCHGPGSFTGLRIGVTAMKTMAQSLGRPLVGISSLEAIALPYFSTWPGTVVSILYCRTGEVYRAAYAEGGAALLDPAVRTVAEVNDEMAGLPGPLLVSGEAGPKDTLVLPPGTRTGDSWLNLPQIDRLALEGHRRLAAGEGQDPLSLNVLYLKRSQAEEQWEAYRKAKHEG